MKNDPTKTIFPVKIEPSLHRQIKIIAAKNGKTMNEFFIEAVKEKLERR